MAERQPAFGKSIANRPVQQGGGFGGAFAAGFWHRPDRLNFVSDLLILVASVAFGYAAVKAAFRYPIFGIHEIVVTSPLSHVTTEQIEYAAASSMGGNFFTVDLEQARKSFESLPWVRKAQLRRHWPSKVEVQLEEHQAAAYWRSADSGDTRLVNTFGELFDAASNAPMPVFSGPTDAGQTMLKQLEKFDEILQPIGRKAVAVTLSGRRAWQLRLDDGMLIELGRDQAAAPLDALLARFVSYWPQAQQHLNTQVAVADLRYPSGFSIRLAGKQEKGKQ